MSDRDNLYNALSEALSQCDNAAYYARKIGAYRIQALLEEAFSIVDKAEQNFSSSEYEGY